MQDGMSTKFAVGLAAFAALMSGIAAAQAQGFDASKDYRINLIIGYEPGGGYDVYGRFAAQMLGRHLPGKPTIVPQNMPGAGSLKAANYLYNVAPKDGTAIGTVNQSIAFMELLGQKGIQFESGKFNWIGRMSDVVSLVGVWKTAPVRTIEDTKTKEVTIAVGGPLSGSVLTVAFLNRLVGTKLKAIAGYTGAQATLAMERGEIDGSSSLLLPVIKAQDANWNKPERNIFLLVQTGPARHADLPDVPLFSELGATEEDRKTLAVVSSSDVIGRSLVAPPGLPKERVEQLRRGFDAMMKDPEAIALAGKMKLDLNPMTGEDLAGIIAQYKELSPVVVEGIRQITGKGDGN